MNSIGVLAVLGVMCITAIVLPVSIGLGLKALSKITGK